MLGHIYQSYDVRYPIDQRDWGMVGVGVRLDGWMEGYQGC